MDEKKQKIYNNDEIDVIALLGIYLEEWKHRDEILWIQSFRFFYATLIVMLIPNLTTYLKICLPSSIPVKAFPVIGLIMSIVFLFISLQYAMRLSASADTYEKIINILDEKYRRVSLEKMHYGKLFKIPISILFPVLMFLALFVVGIVLIIN